MNLCEIGLFHIVLGASKGTRENYPEIWCENNVLIAKYIDIYQFRGYAKGVIYFLFIIPLFIYFFIIHKNGKSTRAWHILKSNSTSFWFTSFFPRMNNKNFMKRGQKGAQLLCLYEVSMVVLVDFKVILVSPGIFLKK